MLLVLLCLAPAVAQVTAGQSLEPTVTLNVRAEPSGLSHLVGRLAPGTSVRGLDRVEGGGCDDPWVLLDGGGYACGSFLETTARLPVDLPALVAFDPPRPDEYEQYRDGGSYDQAPVDQAEALLPFIYGKRWRSWKGHVWASAQAFEAGEDPVDRLDRNSKHAFVEAVDTARGQVLVQDDGTVVPADEVFLYPVDRFVGRELAAEPVAEGRLPAWAFRYDGARVRTAPDPKAEVGLVLPYHQALEVDATPASPDGHWWRVVDGLGEGVDGYVDDRSDVRHWVPSPAPADLGSDQLWLDVDTLQQVAALRQGPELLYVTLVSTGTGGKHETPVGVYTLTDKLAWGDMASLPGADEPYHVDKVPWIAHFWPRFALHGVFWHWGFGHRASHGCINLAPRDAAWLFQHMGPELPTGWHTVYETAERPGAVLRVRQGTGAVPDRRRN